MSSENQLEFNNEIPSRIKILYVEDDPRDIDLINDRLESEGDKFELHSVGYGRKFLEQIKHIQYDLFLIDYQLPDLTGIELLTEINKRDIQVPVILLTGMGNEDLVIKALHGGAIDYIPKRSEYLKNLPQVLIRAITEYKKRTALHSVFGVRHFKILYVEDSPKDIELMAETFKQNAPNMSLISVLTSAEGLKILQAQNDISLVLCDIRLIGNSALDFYREVKNIGIDLPFIFITAYASEETAIASLKMGVYDYIIKRDSYEKRVPLAIESAIAKYQLEKIKIKLQKDLAEANKKLKDKVVKQEKDLKQKEIDYNALVENAQDAIFTIGKDGKIKSLNRIFENMTGWKISDWIDKDFTQIVYKEDLRIASDYFIKILNDEILNSFEIRVLKKDGSFSYFDFSVFPQKTGDEVVGVQGIARNVDERKKQDEEIKKLTKDKLLILDSAGEGILGVDNVGKATFINSSALKMLGYEESEVIGINIHQKIHHSTIDGTSIPFEKCSIYEAIKFQRKTRRDDEVFWKKDGTYFYAEFATHPLIENNKVIGAVVTFFDITERKESELKEKDSKKYLQYIIDSSMDMIITVDNERRIVEFNKAAEQIFGYSKAEISGEHINILYADKTEGTRTFQNVFNDENYFGEILNKRKNGETFPCLLSASIMKNEKGEIIGGVGVSKDITDIKKVQQELIEAKENAEEMNRLKSSFLNNMSHELRTPLIAILGFAEILENELLSDEQKSMVQSIINGGKRLSNTLNLILDLSKIEGGKMQYQLKAINIAKEVSVISENFKPAAIKKKIDFEISLNDFEINANLDERMFTQIIENLVDNAIKFTKAGKVVVEVNSKVENISGNNEQFVEIKVIDTGIGIPEDSLKFVFDEFRQVSEGLSRAFEGTGLGLTITKKFVEKMNGKIFVESKLNEGSVFKVLFPAYYSDTPLIIYGKKYEMKKSMLEISNINLPEIIIIDDDPIAIAVSKAYLKDICKIDSAENGKTALEKCSKKKYKAILLDINLGFGMNGLDTLKKIRAIEGYNDLSVVAFTAYAMAGDKEKFLDSGCTHYISKPFLKEEFIQLIKDVLNG